MHAAGSMLCWRHRRWSNFDPCAARTVYIMFLAPAVTIGETEGAMDSASVFFFCL